VASSHRRASRLVANVLTVSLDIVLLVIILVQILTTLTVTRYFVGLFWHIIRSVVVM